jgi:hypothetical protein
MPTVAVCGCNLMMSAIGAILQKRPDLQMQQLQKWPMEGMEILNTAPPEVILFDLAVALPDFTLSILQNNPQTKLVGIDMAGHQMLVISGVQSRLRTVDDLVELLNSSECFHRPVDPDSMSGASK